MTAQPNEEELFGDSIDEAIERYLSQEPEDAADTEETAHDDSLPESDEPDADLQDEASSFAEEAKAEGEVSLLEADDSPDEELTQAAQEFADESLELDKPEDGGDLEDLALSVEGVDKPTGNDTETEEEPFDEQPPEPEEDVESRFDSMWQDRQSSMMDDIRDMIDERIDSGARRRQL